MPATGVVSATQLYGPYGRVRYQSGAREVPHQHGGAIEPRADATHLRVQRELLLASVATASARSRKRSGMAVNSEAQRLFAYQQARGSGKRRQPVVSVDLCRPLALRHGKVAQVTGKDAPANVAFQAVLAV